MAFDPRYEEYDQYGGVREKMATDQYGSPITLREKERHASPEWRDYGLPGAGGAPGTGDTPGAGGSGGLTPEQQGAKAILQSFLRQWGLESLGADVERLIKEGLGQEAIQVQLQQTAAWKSRFKANEERVKAGLAVLSPAEYIATEAAYRQVMQSYGLPSGFWDSTDDFTGLLARDVAPAEVNERVKVARDAFLSADDGVKQMWREFYGLSDGAGIAAILDPGRAMPIVQRMATAATAGAAATRNGLNADRGRLETYADQGFTADQLSQAFSEIGAVRRTEEGLANRFGQGFTQADSEAARIQGTASAARKQRELYQSEQALFDQRAAGDIKSLNQRQGGRF